MQFYLIFVNNQGCKVEIMHFSGNGDYLYEAKT